MSSTSRVTSSAHCASWTITILSAYCAYWSYYRSNWLLSLPFIFRVVHFVHAQYAQNIQFSYFVHFLADVCPRISIRMICFQLLLVSLSLSAWHTTICIHYQHLVICCKRQMEVFRVFAHLEWYGACHSHRNRWEPSHYGGYLHNVHRLRAFTILLHKGR